ncbi:MAG: hypothetical protein GXO23_03405 [Crenarchaeota archaeon]|nr:hypothetical protein [Thermoproteota archaeon]
MKVDLVLSVERYDHATAFYPLSLTTPVQNLIYGGLRLFEHVLLNMYISTGYLADILNIVRNSLAVDWRSIYKTFIIERALDKNVKVMYIGDRDIRGLTDILSRYDTLVISYSNSINIDMNRLLRTKDIDVSEIKNLTYLPFKYGASDIENVRSILDIVENNVLMIREICKKLKISDNRIIIDADIGSHVSIPKSCVLFLCKIQDNTRLRDGCVLYPGSVIGCEVKNTIVDVYSHVEHSGYVGDSYLGRFVNVGAGTVFSNLKNTKGRVKYLGVKSRLIKLGSIMGDHVKTSIGTLVYSGKCVGSYSHVYGLVNVDVPPVAIYRDGKIERMVPDKLRIMLERWCKKYIGDKGLECELKVLDRVFMYLSTLLEESLSNVVPLYVE